jgi:hypothetical protein
MVNLSHEAQGPVMHFPMGRNLAGGSIGIIFGAIFAGAGWFMINAGGAPFMGAIFGLVGLLVVFSSFYMVLNSLEVVQDGGSIRTVRRILGIPVKRGQMRRSDFVMFRRKASSTTQSGKRHMINYKISAVDRHGHKLIMGEGFKNARQADTAADFVSRTFGLVQKDSAPGPDIGVEDHNLLTTDLRRS